MAHQVENSCDPLRKGVLTLIQNKPPLGTALLTAYTQTLTALPITYIEASWNPSISNSKFATNVNQGPGLPGTYSSLRFFIFTKASDWTDLIALSPRFLQKNTLHLQKHTLGAHVFEPGVSRGFQQSPGLTRVLEALATPRVPSPLKVAVTSQTVAQAHGINNLGTRPA